MRRSRGGWRWLLAIALALLALIILVPGLIVSPTHPGGQAPDGSQPRAGRQGSVAGGPRPQVIDPKPQLPGGGGQLPGLLSQLQLTLYDRRDNRKVHLSFRQYMIGAVAAEMPASFQPEALKAQAVATRTYTLRLLPQFGGPGCHGADLCSDPQHGQAWVSDKRLHQRWGDQYEQNLQRISGAVEQTQGLIVTYHQQPAETLYFSASGGETASSKYRWGKAVPYLVPVSSPYEQAAPYWHQHQSFSFARVESRLGLPPGSLQQAASSSQTVAKVLARSASGRVQKVRIAGKLFSGPTVREKLDLNSTLFTLSVKGHQLVFNVNGLGHGVGLSQWGAQGYALHHWTFRQILAHYYPGTAVTAWTQIQ